MQTAHVTVRADFPVKRRPRRVVLPAGVSRIRVQILERAAILHDQKIGEASLVAESEEALVRIGCQLIQHGRHGLKERQAFIDIQEFIGAHANQKHDKRSINFCSHAFGG